MSGGSLTWRIGTPLKRDGVGEDSSGIVASVGWLPRAGQRGADNISSSKDVRVAPGNLKKEWETGRTAEEEL